MRRCNSQFAVVVALLALAPAARAQATSPAACPTPNANAVQRTVLPVAIAGGTATLHLRVADSYAKREYGLMCVRALESRSGMIFVFADGDRSREFWMKNTLIPLDMLFVANDGRVNSIAANVPATTVETPDEKIPRRSGTGTFVVELGAGDAARVGIAPGTRLVLSRIRSAKE